MIKTRNFQPQFVVDVPEKLSPGVLYLSMECAVVTHLCCCGCGTEVVTPLTRDGWKITFDGESISLWPSVGNWNLPCRSHYVIDHNRVVDVPERKGRDQISGGHLPLPYPVEDSTTATETRPGKSGFWSKLKRGLLRKDS